MEAGISAGPPPSRVRRKGGVRRVSKGWTLEDIDWTLFDPQKVNPNILAIIKAGSVVEHNGSDYGKYLKNVFSGDAKFVDEIEVWSQEEIKHGKTLAAWIKLADPTFNFEERFATYVEGYPIAVNASESIRGSRASELLSRCMVEIGTSSFYTAVKEASDEPLLQKICARIAADELRHYKLFYTHFLRYQKNEKMSLFKKFKVAVSRLFENEDDELAFAYFTANKKPAPYNREKYTHEYGKTVYRLYQKTHVDRGMALFCKALQMNPQGLFHKIISWLAYTILSSKAKSYERQLEGQR